MKYSELEKNKAKEYLLSIMCPDTTIYTVLKHVSSSGMSREISVYIVVNNESRCIDYYLSRLLDCRLGKHNGLIVEGCGMDMGFDIAYSLFCTLFPAEKYQEHLRQSWL